MTYRLGMICRADQGGLGAQTWEAFRHLHPAVTVVMDLGAAGRGPADLRRYQAHADSWGGELMVVPDAQLPGGAAAWLAERCDVIFTAETTYGAHVPEVAAAHGAQVVVQANPELYREADYPGARIVLPTPWEAQRVAAAERVLEVPVATDVLRWRRRTRVRRYYHLCAPAMGDRNGTVLLAQALPHVRSPVEVWARGEGARRLTRRSTRHRVPVRTLAAHDGPYHQAWPADVDVLVIPRRYAGNFMPAQEAAALGMPVVALDLPPQDAWPHVVGVQPCTPQPVAMRGGTFDVWACAPQVLAETLDDLHGDPDRVEALSVEARCWAEARSWEVMLPVYREALAPC